MSRRRSHDEEMDQLEQERIAAKRPADEEYDDYEDETYDYGYGDDEPYDEEEQEEEGAGGLNGFLSTAVGKVAVAVIALLLVAMMALLVWRFVFSDTKKQESENLPADLPSSADTVDDTATNAPGTIVFAPAANPTATPTAEPEVQTPQPTATPTAVPTHTPAPTDTPEPTATPLPIILTNTPTPSPSPTASPTPSPSPTPTPSPKPTATPVVKLATGETNREAKLRESASSSASVKKTVKKGLSVTIHEVLLDKDGKVWYSVTVDDLNLQGFMRDYIIDVDGKLAAPTATPKASATPKAGEEAADAAVEATASPETQEPVSGIGTGKTNRDANVRKIMNGKVITQLRQGKKVTILDAKLDKNGDLWYEIKVDGTTTTGFVRDYVIKLDSGVTIAKPTAAPGQAVSPTPEATGTTDAAGTTESSETNVLDREVIGKAKTNRTANVREKPVSGAKIVRQLSQGNELLILDKYAEGDSIWYEVATESGRTYGFVRDYVINITEIDKDIEAKTYENQ